MHRHLSIEAKCGLFAGSIFIFFFLSALISTAKANSIVDNLPRIVYDHAPAEKSLPSVGALKVYEDPGASGPVDSAPGAGGPSNLSKSDGLKSYKPPLGIVNNWWMRFVGFVNRMLAAIHGS